MSSSPHEDEPRYGRRLEHSDGGHPGPQQPGGWGQPGPDAAGQSPSGQAPAEQNPYGQNPEMQNPYGPSAGSAASAPDASPGPGQYGAPYGPGSQQPPAQSPYGQDFSGQAGQSPYGQQQPGGAPYGGASGSPYGGGPGSSYGGPASQPGWNTQGAGPAEKPRRPWTLLTSLFLVIGAGLVLGIAGALTMRRVQQASPEELMADPESFSGAFWEGFFAEAPPAEHQELLTVFGVMALVFAIIGFLVYLALAFVGAFAGHPGRIIATIVLGLGLVGNLLAIFPYGPWMLLVAALSLVAIILYWLPQTNSFIRRRRELRQGGVGAYPGAPGGPGYGPGPTPYA